MVPAATVAVLFDYIEVNSLRQVQNNNSACCLLSFFFCFLVLILLVVDCDGVMVLQVVSVSSGSVTVASTMLC